MKEFLRRFLFFLLACICCSPLIWAFTKGANQNIKILSNEYNEINAKILNRRDKSADGYEWSEIKLEYSISKDRFDTISILYYTKLDEKEKFVKLYIHKTDKSNFITRNKLIYDNFFLLFYSVGIIFLIYLLFGCVKSLWNLIKALLRK